MSVREILEKAKREAVDARLSDEAGVLSAGIDEALAALDAEGVGLPWVSVESELPDEDGPDVLAWNTKWVDVLPAIDISSDDKGWYWLPLSAIPLPGQSSEPSAALRARVEALEAFVQDLADESCRNQEACGETNLRLIDYCGPCRARALLEKTK